MAVWGKHERYVCHLENTACYGERLLAIAEDREGSLVTAA